MVKEIVVVQIEGGLFLEFREKLDLKRARSCEEGEKLVFGRKKQK